MVRFMFEWAVLNFGSAHFDWAAGSKAVWFACLGGRDFRHFLRAFRGETSLDLLFAHPLMKCVNVLWRLEDQLCDGEHTNFGPNGPFFLR